jgi:hypothetical protein
VLGLNYRQYDHILAIYGPYFIQEKSCLSALDAFCQSARETGRRAMTRRAASGALPGTPTHGKPPPLPGCRTAVATAPQNVSSLAEQQFAHPAWHIDC